MERFNNELTQAVNEVLENEINDLTPIYSWQIDKNVSKETLVKCLKDIPFYSISASLPGCLPDYQSFFISTYEAAKKYFIDEMIDRVYAFADDEGNLPASIKENLDYHLEYYRTKPFRANIEFVLPNDYVLSLIEHTADELLVW